MKYILSQINNHLQETEETKINWSKVSLEHLLPQNPSPDWQLTKAQIKPYVDKLGNLTIVDKHINSKIGNQSLNNKLKVLKISNLPITRDLITEVENNGNVWNEEGINTRLSKLAELSYDAIWNL